MTSFTQIYFLHLTSNFVFTADYIGRYQSLSSQFEFRLEDVFMGTILSNIDVFAQLLSLPNPMEKDWFYRAYHGYGTYDRSQFMVSIQANGERASRNGSTSNCS